MILSPALTGLFVHLHDAFVASLEFLSYQIVMGDDVVQFLKAALKNPLEVSTVFPTSKALALRMLREVPDFDGQIVELGTGTGAITRFLSAKILDPTQYLGLDLSEEMIGFMRKAYPHLRFEASAADQLPQLCPDGSVSAVVSSLPWTLFSPSTQESTLKAIKNVLKPEGVFITYMCLNTAWTPAAQNFMRLLREHFTGVTKGSFEWRNMPPARVIVSRSLTL